MSEKDDLIAMQMNLGLGHKGEIILTTQGRVNENQPMIAKDVIDVEHAERLVLSWNSHDKLTEQRDKLRTALEEIEKTISKLFDDADTERFSRQDSQDSDFYLSEGKFIGIEKAESQIGKIINEAKAILAETKD